GESEADEIDVTGSFDLTNHLLETLTQFPAEDVEGGVAGVRSKVIDKEIFAGPDFGPYKECWFKYTSAAIGDIIGAELPVDTGSAWIPSAVALVTDAHALGSTARGDYEIRAKVSAQLALAAISQKFAAKKYKILPDEEVRAIGTITLRNGVYDTLTVRGEDVVNALKKAGVDLFKGEAMGVETFFRTAKMVTTFESFGALVTVERPAPRTIVEMKGNDQVNSGQTTCTQATS
ncbi:MAG: hypothetical protein JWR83_2867, partial [Aeromicrobium sp.]|nr:hypothetical protein [Aeromicrobium sp.]